MPQTQVIKSDGSKLVKKFKCNYCDRYFTRSEHRSRHELSHSNERPYRCTQCVSSFVRRDLLLRHCRTVHGGDIMPPPKKAKSEKKEVRRPSAADSLLSLANANTNANNSNTEITAAMLMTEMHGYQGMAGGAGPAGSGEPHHLNRDHHHHHQQQQQHHHNQSNEFKWYSNSHSPPPTQAQAVMATSPRAAKVPSQGPTQTPTVHMYTSPEQRGLSSLQSINNMANLPYDGGPPPPSSLAAAEPLTEADLEQIKIYLPKVSFEPPLFTRVAPDINTSVPVPQFGPKFDARAFLDHLRQRPSIRQGFVNAKDITRLQMDRYLSAFFCFFHPIMPMFHTQTFNTHSASPFLMYSILAMGAVLCHEETVAQLFSYNSRIVLNPEAFAGQDQLELSQTLILIIIFASYTGDMAGAEIANARAMLLRTLDQVLDNHNLRSPGQKHRHYHSWHEWIAEQIIIRTYFCGLIAVTTMAAIFNASGVVSLESLPYDLLLPCSEVLWNNQFLDEHAWRTRMHQELDEIPLQTMGELLTIVDNAQDYVTAPPILNPFSVRILGNILFLRASGVTPGTDHARKKLLGAQISLWQSVARDPYPGMGQGAMLAMANLPLVSLMKPLVYQNENSLDLPQSILMAMQCRQHPIIILSYTLLGTARLQLILDLGLVRESLNYRSAERVAEASLTCLTSLQGHGDEILEQMTSVVIGSCDVIRAICLLGQRMYQAFLQSPLTGSIAGQCMILAYELILGIIIWCHRVEERLRESAANSNVKPLKESLHKVYQWVTEICREAGIHQVYGTLAPALAESIAELYDAIKTWRLAEVMAMSLRLFARGLLNSHSEIMQARYNQGYYSG